MTDAKHTEGPWSTGRGMFDAICANDDSLICRLSSVDYRTGRQIERSNSEDLANARLIAAAPDLLKELKKATSIIGRLSTLVRHYGYVGEMPPLRTIERKAAIAKAEGKDAP